MIFSSRHASEQPDYAAVAERMETLAQSMPGFQGVESARGADGFGITVSYWDSLAHIAAWRAEEEHAQAQQQGRDRFYATYELCVARVERHTTFDRARSPARVERF